MSPAFLTLDFGAAPAPRLLRSVVFGIGALALVVGAAQLADAWHQQSVVRAELASLHPRTKNKTVSRAGPADVAPLRAAVAVARDLRAPWPELMAAVEASRSTDISLLQIEPVVARDSVRITADARHADAMLDYLEQLQRQGLSEVVLTTHELRTQEPGNPLRFQAQARWTSLASRRQDADSARVKPTDAEAAAHSADLAALQAFIEQERSPR